MIIKPGQSEKTVKPLMPVALNGFSAEDLKRYHVSASRIVLRLLKEIEAKRIPVHVFSNALNIWYPTEILHVDETDSQLFFRAPLEQELCRAISQCPKLTITTIIDNIRIQFYVETNQIMIHSNRRALCTSFPLSFYRIQRRDSVRLKISGSPMVRCEITYPGTLGRPMRGVFPVYDISLGGISLYNAPIHKVGLEIKGARIMLPEVELVTVDLIVRNVIKAKGRGNSIIQRVGCQFVDLPIATENKIQRYLLRLDHEQKSNSHG